VRYETPAEASWNKQQQSRAGAASSKAKGARGGKKLKLKKGPNGIVQDETGLPSIQTLTPEMMANGSTRKPRKDKGIARKKKDAANEEATAVADSTRPAAVASARVANAEKRKQKAAAKAAAVASLIDGSTPDMEGSPENGAFAPKPRRKSGPRKPRGEVLAEHESVMFAEGVVTMYQLSARNVHTGEKSEREKLMEQINWKEVNERRKEEERRNAMRRGRLPLGSDEEDQENQSQVEEDEDDIDAQLARAVRKGGTKQQTLRTKIVDGRQVIDETSRVVDREALANRDLDADEEIEENDLTRKFNSHTYQGLYRKDPAERIRTYNRWTDGTTDKFYECLSRYGTDFMIISKMMPGRTRREVKAKFVKEERSDPERIKDALQQAHAAGSDTWDLDHFMMHARIGNDDLLDPREKYKELERNEEERREEIEEAKKIAAEEKRQRELAGVKDSDDEGSDVSDSGKKKKRIKERKKTKARKEKYSSGIIGGDEEAEVIYDEDDAEP
jgi:transcription factor TFIIIB component B''